MLLKIVILILSAMLSLKTIFYILSSLIFFFRKMMKGATMVNNIVKIGNLVRLMIRKKEYSLESKCVSHTTSTINIKMSYSSYSYGIVRRNLLGV